MHLYVKVRLEHLWPKNPLTIPEVQVVHDVMHMKVKEMIGFMA